MWLDAETAFAAKGLAAELQQNAAVFRMACCFHNIRAQSRRFLAATLSNVKSKLPILPRQIAFQNWAEGGKEGLGQLVAASLRKVNQIDEFFMDAIEMPMAIDQTNLRI